MDPMGLECGPDNDVDVDVDVDDVDGVDDVDDVDDDDRTINSQIFLFLFCLE